MSSMQGPDWEDAGRAGLYLGLAGYRAGSEAGSTVGRVSQELVTELSRAGESNGSSTEKVGGGELRADEGRGHSCREPAWR